MDTTIAAPSTFLWPFIEYDAHRNKGLDARAAPLGLLSDLAIKAAVDYNALYEGSERYDQIREAMKYRFALSLKAAGLGGGFEWLPRHSPPLETAPPITSDRDYEKRLAIYGTRFWLSAYAARQDSPTALNEAADFMDDFEGKSGGNIAIHGIHMYEQMRDAVISPKRPEHIDHIHFPRRHITRHCRRGAPVRHLRPGQTTSQNTPGHQRSGHLDRSWPKSW